MTTTKTTTTTMTTTTKGGVRRGRSWRTLPRRQWTSSWRGGRGRWWCATTTVTTMANKPILPYQRMPLPVAAGTTTMRHCGYGVAGGQPTEEGGASLPEQQRSGGGEAHHRRNDDDDGYQRGHHCGGYDAMGGGGGGGGDGGAVGWAIKGVRQLRPSSRPSPSSTSAVVVAVDQ